jgi:ABC-type glycerol-3-phosphate transport system substrate-binding protein
MKLNSFLIRFLLLTLCVSLLAGCFVACKSESTDVAESSDTQTDDSNQIEDPNISEKYIEDSLPEDLNFQKEFLLFASDNQKSHYWADAAGTGVIDQAIYLRNSTVETRLGITINWDFMRTNSSSEKKDFIRRLETDADGGNSIDAVVTYNLIPYALAQKGLASNLADTAYIDLEGPWWPSEYLDSMLYNGKVFALVESCGIGTLTNLSGIFFNNTLLEAKNLQSPYELVEKNEWTIGKLKELIKDTYEDKNQDGKEDELDVYGLCTSSAPRLSCWYYGAGARFSALDETGELQLIATDVESMTIVVDALVDLFSTKDTLLYENDATRYSIFREERVYFYLSTIALCSNLVSNNVEVNYGVAPNPKFNSEQDRYYTHLPNSHDAWYIPKGVKDLDCSSAVLECMASESYRQLDELFFENTVKLRYAPDERLADMYDLIRDSITFDFVYIYKEVFSKNCDYKLLDCFKTPDTHKWATVWAGIKDAMNDDFLELLALYQN